MRLPDSIKECVCFLCIRWPSGPNAGHYESKGTAILIVMREQGFDFLYLVTAKHIVDWVKKHRDKFDTIYARLNTNDGGHEYLDVGLNWVVYDETKHDIDIALTPVPFDWKVYAYQALPVRMIATPEKIVEHGIGIGDDLFATGLFVRREGTRQNIPIVRIGTIAAMPGEPLLGRSGRLFTAYLIEMLSIGGLSGSPVYAYIDVHRCVDPKIPNEKNWMFFLLGLIRGHWNLHDIEFSSADTELQNDTPSVRNERLNTGIAVVTPAEYIYAMLMSPALSKTRKDFLAMKDPETASDEDIPKDEPP